MIRSLLSGSDVLQLLLSGADAARGGIASNPRLRHEAVASLFQKNSCLPPKLKVWGMGKLPMTATRVF
jgi:hypothetical protein